MVLDTHNFHLMAPNKIKYLQWYFCNFLGLSVEPH